MNLLNNYKTKFNCNDIDVKKEKTESLIIQFTFPKPIQISGFGFRSANNYPHLDPAELSIHCHIEYMDKRSKKIKLKKLKTHSFQGENILMFDYRLQMK
jgi:hypothetical protein